MLVSANTFKKKRRGKWGSVAEITCFYYLLWGFNKQLLYFFLRLHGCCLSIFFYREIFSLPLSFSPLEAISSVLSLLSFPGWCVCVEVRLFVLCRCCLCCVGLVARIPLFPNKPQQSNPQIQDLEKWPQSFEDRCAVDSSVNYTPVATEINHYEGLKTSFCVLFHYSSSYSEVWAHQSLV